MTDPVNLHFLLVEQCLQNRYYSRSFNSLLNKIILAWSKLKALEDDNIGVNREYVHSVAVYQKYLTRLGELILFQPWRENYHFHQQLDIFDIRQDCVCILFIFHHLIC